MALCLLWISLHRQKLSLGGCNMSRTGAFKWSVNVTKINWLIRIKAGCNIEVTGTFLAYRDQTGRQSLTPGDCLNSKATDDWPKKKNLCLFVTQHALNWHTFIRIFPKISKASLQTSLPIKICSLMSELTRVRNSLCRDGPYCLQWLVCTMHRGLTCRHMQPLFKQL